METMDQKQAEHIPQNRSILLKLVGEWSWEKYIVGVLGIACLVDALISNDFGLRSVARDGAFHSALLFLLMFYLSELRYKLVPEARNN
jgi:hypothetical protein